MSSCLFGLFGFYITSTIFHIMMSGCGRELNAHFLSAASLKYHDPDTWCDIPRSHIVLTPGWPVLIPSSTQLVQFFTLKMPRKPASENVVCLSYYMSSAEYSCKLYKPVFAYRQTCGPWSDCSLRSSLIWVHTVCKNDLKSKADDKADDNRCEWQFKG